MENILAVSHLGVTVQDIDFIENTSQGIRKTSSLRLFMDLQKGSDPRSLPRYRDSWGTIERRGGQ